MATTTTPTTTGASGYVANTARRRRQGPIRHTTPENVNELTARTQQARFLMKPSAAVTDAILGCIGRAQQLYDVRLHGFVFMSNHYHMLATADDAKQLAQFTGHINGNVARELNRLNDSSGRVWQRRFRAVPVDGNERAQLERLKYLISHGVKERIVKRVRDWTGASSVPWMLDGAEVAGHWHHRTAQYNDQQRGADRGDEFYRERIVLKFTPLPCFDAMAEGEWRSVVAAMAEEIEAEYDEARSQDGVSVLGMAVAEAMDPQHMPLRCARSNAPLVHAVSCPARSRWREEKKCRRSWYQEASKRFRAGDWAAEFPPGVHRPGGRFVPLLDDDAANREVAAA